MEVTRSKLSIARTASMAAIVWIIGGAPVIGQVDTDFDGICDELEQTILSDFAPVWRANDDGQRPPLPVDWYVAHCQLRWYDREYNGSSNPGVRLGSTGNAKIDVALLGDYPYQPAVYYRLHLLDTYEDGRRYESRWGEDPRDWISWQSLQAQQRGVYGRVHPLSGLPQYPECGPNACDEHLLVQYYMFFGYNVTDHPDEAFGPCGNYGNHEGDVACVEFELGRVAGGGYSITRAVYHDHSREIFVDSPASLYFELGRPIVFLERETNEAVPWPGNCGLRNGHFVPPCVGTNETYHPIHIPVPGFGTWEFGGECDDYQVVREHNGRHFGVNNPGFLVTAVVNLGESGIPGSSSEARFLDRYPGLLGDEAFDEGCFCYLGGMNCFHFGDGVTSPKTPQHQGRLWNRARHNDPRDGEFPGCRASLNTAFVEFQGSVPGDGSFGSPLRTLRSAVGGVVDGGTVVLLRGHSPELVTISKRMTITSAGGPVTIGE